MWPKFLACALLLCLIYPPFLGCVIGVAGFFFAAWIVANVMESL